MYDLIDQWLFARLLSRVHHYHLSAEGDDNPGGGIAGGEAGGESVGAGDGAAQPGAGGGGGLAGLADDGGDVVDPAAAASEDDWRTAAAGGDEKLLRELKRYASPQTVAKALIEAKARIRAGFQPPALPDGATPEQIAEYRKTVGVPETPDGYGVAFPAEIQADEQLTGMLQSFTNFAHERNIPPSAVKAAVEWQAREIIRQRDEATAAVAREQARVKQELGREYGADFKRNLRLADEFLEAHPGLAKVVRADNPDLELVRDIIALARDTAPEDRLYEGDAGSSGKSLDEQIAEYRVKSVNGTLTKSENDKYNQLLAARITRDERKSRGRVAA